ncbi:hypothetical protein KXW39_006160 [Aspergillus fumigatus]|nr:hypothetical protein KXX17_003518 [Aspergillus fumigatus]KAH3308715.1 hypothetical protein KXV87_006278 [Aspergillus fumigatus]KAH3446268.1 hypothetical protein KXW39_006160 [Aspergillus fumigatus]
MQDATNQVLVSNASSHANMLIRFKLENLFSVKGRVALVTGGGSGIGLMIIQALTVSGAKVYITGRTGEKLDRVAELYSHNIPGQIIPITADVTSKQSIQKLVDEISSEEKALHILVNNAGISGTTQDTDSQSAEELHQKLFKDESNSVEEWDEIFRTNVTQLYFTTAAFLPLLNNSISGILKTAQHHFHYNASKGAAIHVSRMLAHGIASSNLKIRVNNIAPGVFPLEMTANDSDEKQKSSLPKEKYEGKVPAGRPGKDKDMGSAIFSICNQYLNGQTIVVDGGFVLAAGTV